MTKPDSAQNTMEEIRFLRFVLWHRHRSPSTERSDVPPPGDALAEALSTINACGYPHLSLASCRCGHTLAALAAGATTSPEQRASESSPRSNPTPAAVVNSASGAPMIAVLREVLALFPGPDALDALAHDEAAWRPFHSKQGVSVPTLRRWRAALTAGVATEGEEIERLRAALRDAEARNRRSFCTWCGEEAEHPSLEARADSMMAHTVDCAKRPERVLLEFLLGYEAMLLDAFAMLQRATTAEDPDAWLREGLALLERLAPIANEIRKRAVPTPDAEAGRATEGEDARIAARLAELNEQWLLVKDSAVAGAVAVEREACARIAGSGRFVDGPSGTVEGQIARAIRARTQSAPATPDETGGAR